ncbi:MAG: MarR family transcriptional regulator [bacterium]|nr:MarR family transcriptional regulator [bacterium]
MKNHIQTKEKHIRCMEHYDKMDINGRLIISLRDLSHTMRSLYEGKGSQKRIMIILNETGTITQRALTARLGIQPGSASEVFMKLENAGLIKRTPSNADRRTADITLTEEGKRLAAKASEQRGKRHEEMFTCLSDREKSDLLVLLEKINTDWETRYAGIKNDHRH